MARKRGTNAGMSGACTSESSLKTEEKIERQCGQHGDRSPMPSGMVCRLLELSVNSLQVDRVPLGRNQAGTWLITMDYSSVAVMALNN